VRAAEHGRQYALQTVAGLGRRLWRL